MQKVYSKKKGPQQTLWPTPRGPILHWENSRMFFLKCTLHIYEYASFPNKEENTKLKFKKENTCKWSSISHCFACCFFTS